MSGGGNSKSGSEFASGTKSNAGRNNEMVRGKIAGYKRPREVEIIPELPKSPVGKILKRDLRDQMNEKKSNP